ncbi:hypothetical protein [Holdemanella biformis]|jgi:hypothetical protein|nr:MAG TPA: hypothetical protein [Caudoviricetes sp.]
MLKKTITYEDFNGVERKEDFYFNLSKAEIMEMQFGTVGGLDVMLKKIIDAKDVKSIMDTFKMLILKAYGIKSDDGRRFIKSEEIAKEFEQTEAYSILYMELASDDNAAAEFVNGIIPKDVATEVSNQMKAIN